MESQFKRIEDMLSKGLDKFIQKSVQSGDYFSAEKGLAMRKWIRYGQKLTYEQKIGRLFPTGRTRGIMFIGINPSHKSTLTNVWKDNFGINFAEMLKEAEIDPYEVWMTNLYKKATENNRPLNEEEIEEGLKEIDLEIGYVWPKVIVCLGKQVYESILTIAPEGKWKGIPVVALHHPSYIMRKPDERPKYLLNLNNLLKYE